MLCLALLLLPEFLTQQPPEMQVAPEIVYRTVQNEQGILQNPAGWFVFKHVKKLAELFNSGRGIWPGGTPLYKLYKNVQHQRI